ncbi:MAG: HD domain-containing protein [Oscillospiraceae bacterium]|jgi:HD superfamily phosphohydrolase|nr:HD domain-containing protein [Oscillospiraceae bacterium]
MNKIIRDTVCGFIELDEQELDIIQHPVFQRLRRIRQLALTDMVYPGAVHTRFEHSLGVMQTATEMYDHIAESQKDLLQSVFSLDVGVKRYRKIVRLAALLHDVGHPPFSHAGEELLSCEHEDYSRAAVKSVFRELIEDHRINRNYGIKAAEVSVLLGDPDIITDDPILNLWKELISSQLDADRADYLLRDSLHAGVEYGHYDRERLIHCMAFGQDPETGTYRLAINYRGWHVAESLVFARYQMFTQVYFHKVRRIYDFHVTQAVCNILEPVGGKYPPLTELEQYFDYDDWKIYAAIKDKRGGEHGEIILDRNHWKARAMPNPENLSMLDKSSYYIDDGYKKAWYKLRKNEDIQVFDKDLKLVPLSTKSPVVKALSAPPQTQETFYSK